MGRKSREKREEKERIATIVQQTTSTGEAMKPYEQFQMLNENRKYRLEKFKTWLLIGGTLLTLFTLWWNSRSEVKAREKDHLLRMYEAQRNAYIDTADAIASLIQAEKTDEYDKCLMKVRIINDGKYMLFYPSGALEGKVNAELAEFVKAADDFRTAYLNGDRAAMLSSRATLRETGLNCVNTMRSALVEPFKELGTTIETEPKKFVKMAERIEHDVNRFIKLNDIKAK